MSVSTATQSAPISCICRSASCAAPLFARYPIAMRAPSCARRMAIPRPIPRLPPVTNATRFLSAILLLDRSFKKRRDRLGCSVPPPTLSQFRHNNRHVVRLFRTPGPFLRRDHQRFRNFSRRGMPQSLRRCFQSWNPKLFTVGVLRLDQPVAVSDQDSIVWHIDGFFLKVVVVHDSQHNPAFVEVNGSPLG